MNYKYLITYQVQKLLLYCCIQILRLFSIHINVNAFNQWVVGQKIKNISYNLLQDSSDDAINY